MKINEIIVEGKDSDPCWDNYKQIGMKTKGGRKVPNCVPKEGVAEGTEEGFSIEDMVMDQWRNGSEVWQIASSMGMDEGEVQGIIYDSENGITEGQNGEYDDESGMAETNLHTISRAARGLLDTIDSNENLPEWVQEKIAKVEGMMVTAWDYLKSQEEQGVDPRQGVAEGTKETKPKKPMTWQQAYAHNDGESFDARQKRITQYEKSKGNTKPKHVDWGTHNKVNEQGVAEGYSLKKTSVNKYMEPGDPDEYTQDINIKDTDYEIINNKTGQVVGTASWTTNDFFGPGALKITMKNGATRWLDIWEREKGNPQTAFNRFVKDPKTAKKYKEQGVAEGSDGWIGNPTKWKEAVLAAHGPDVVFKNYSHPGQPGQRSVNAINTAGKQVGVYQRHNKMGMVQPNTQGVAEGLLGSDPNRGQKVPGWAKRGIVGKIGRKLDPSWSDVQKTVPQHLLSKQPGAAVTNASTTKEMPKATSAIPTRAIPKSAVAKPSQPVTKNVVKTIADRQGVAGEQLEETYHDDDEFFEAYGIMEYNGEMINEAEYQGRKVALNKPMQGDVKKFKVYVKNPKGNVVKVNFGQKGAKIKKNNPGRRKNFRARHNCDNPGPKTGARYWSCRAW